ncbi:hypothetical protein HOO68_01645 [Candidatus Gracilibacteria bacterium]|nr:hypothetical protein [Candidatus Gracilibacteria bacterium]
MYTSVLGHFKSTAVESCITCPAELVLYANIIHSNHGVAVVDTYTNVPTDVEDETFVKETFEEILFQFAIAELNMEVYVELLVTDCVKNTETVALSFLHPNHKSA